jgi:hypothetical protein
MAEMHSIAANSYIEGAEISLELCWIGWEAEISLGLCWIGWEAEISLGHEIGISSASNLFSGLQRLKRWSHLRSA